MLLKEEKTEIIEKNRTHENDTGSPEVQIAILTKRIQTWSAEDGWSQKKPSELSEEEGCKPLSCNNREAGYP